MEKAKIKSLIFFVVFSCFVERARSLGSRFAPQTSACAGGLAGCLGPVPGHQERRHAGASSGGEPASRNASPCRTSSGSCFLPASPTSWFRAEQVVKAAVARFPSPARVRACAEPEPPWRCLRWLQRRAHPSPGPARPSPKAAPAPRLRTQILHLGRLWICGKRQSCLYPGLRAWKSVSSLLLPADEGVRWRSVLDKLAISTTFIVFCTSRLRLCECSGLLSLFLRIERGQTPRLPLGGRPGPGPGTEVGSRARERWPARVSGGGRQRQKCLGRARKGRSCPELPWAQIQSDSPAAAGTTLQPKGDWDQTQYSYLCSD